MASALNQVPQMETLRVGGNGIDPRLECLVHEALRACVRVCLCACVRACAHVCGEHTHARANACMHACIASPLHIQAAHRQTRRCVRADMRPDMHIEMCMDMRVGMRCPGTGDEGRVALFKTMKARITAILHEEFLRRRMSESVAPPLETEPESPVRGIAIGSAAWTPKHVTCETSMADSAQRALQGQF